MKKNSSTQDIKANNKSEVEKNNNVTPENYLNKDLHINISQLPENDDYDEEIMSV